MERSNQEKIYKYENVSPATSDAESDFEDERVTRNARGSLEVAHQDQRLLEEEEEREKLLTATSTSKPSTSFFGKRQRGLPPNETPAEEKQNSTRRSRRRRKHGRGKSQDEDGELMFEMEEGGPQSETSSQASRSSSELDKMNLAQTSSSKASHWSRL